MRERRRPDVGDRRRGSLRALDAVAEGRWAPLELAGLEVAWPGGPAAVAINDFAVIRAGSGQVQVSVTVDDVLYAALAGDGLVVATPLGSSAYTMAAGGPVLAPGAEGMAITPLAPHGGSGPATRRREREPPVDRGRARLRGRALRARRPAHHDGRP